MAAASQSHPNINFSHIVKDPFCTLLRLPQPTAPTHGVIRRVPAAVPSTGLPSAAVGRHGVGELGCTLFVIVNGFAVAE